MKEMKHYFLYPSAIFASKNEIMVNTVLGSCVAVCLYDPYLKIGGINHFVLPYWNGRGLASPKYGNIAIDKLVEKMESMGSRKVNMIAKIFGGANIFDSKLEQFQIGNRNIAVACQMLNDLNIKIVSSSTGGSQGRKILFSTSSGEVRQKMIEKKSREFEEIVETD